MTDWVFGEEARKLSRTSPDRVVYDLKRMMGRKYDDPIFQALLPAWPFRNCISRKPDDGTIEITIDNIVCSPVQLQARFLEYLVRIATASHQQTITNVVITVPANFNNFQRQDTLQAAQIAGLQVLRLLHEPTAAAMWFAHHPVGAEDIPALIVIDIGGGTFDVSLIRKLGNEVTVLGVDGDPALGGRDFDAELANLVNQRAIEACAQDLMSKPKLQRKLLVECELAKVTLSGSPFADIDMKQILGDDEDWEPIQVTAEDFSQAAEELFIRCQLPIGRLLDAKGIAPTDCRYLLVGGSSPIQFLSDYLTSYFSRSPEVMNDPRGAIALGASICAAGLRGLHPRTTEGRELAITEISAHSIGTDIVGGKLSIIIPKGTELPCLDISKSFQTVRDNQTGIRVDLFEGEDPVAKNNVLLSDKFVITGLDPRPAGEAIVTVTMNIDQNGILHFRVVEEANQGNVLSGVVDTAAQRDFQLAPKIKEVLGRSMNSQGTRQRASSVRVTTAEFEKMFSLEGMERIERTALGIRTHLLLFNARKFCNQLDAGPQKQALDSLIARLVRESRSSSRSTPIEQQECLIYEVVRTTGEPLPYWVKA